MVQSLAYRSDLFLNGQTGQIIEHPGYLQLVSPGNPGYYWGNFLLFPKPPTPADLHQWPLLFRQAFASYPQVRHVSLGWEGSGAGAAHLFVPQGFEFTADTVMAAHDIRPPDRFQANLSFKTLQATDWRSWIDLELTIRLEFAPKELADLTGNIRYLAGRARNYQALIAAGRGRWFGVWHHNQLVCSLGLFVQDGLGRFQSVITHPQFRRQGLAGSLLYHAAQWGTKQANARSLIIVADPDYHAQDLYQSMGFVEKERQYGLLRPP
jgi:GNAT superfamily N-acetyltransferase